MNRQQRWTEYLAALGQYYNRNETALVPCAHIEPYRGKDVKLGQWASYVRGRYHRGLLSQERIRQLETFDGWDWGPLRPNPTAAKARNEKIAQLRDQGMSLREIGDEFNITRQRVHQILSD